MPLQGRQSRSLLRHHQYHSRLLHRLRSGFCTLLKALATAIIDIPFGLITHLTGVGPISSSRRYEQSGSGEAATLWSSECSPSRERKLFTGKVGLYWLGSWTLVARIGVIPWTLVAQTNT